MTVDRIKRERAIQEVERMSGPAMMKVVRDTQDSQSRGEKVFPSAVKLVDLFNSQVEIEMNRSVVRDWLPRIAYVLLAFLAVVWLLRALGVL